jgi:Tol biopolymer transport system component
MKKTISLVLVLILGLAAEVVKADFTFGEPTNLGPTVNSSSTDFDSSISPDGLSLYFGSNRPGGSGRYDLWVTTRATVSDPWEQPVNLGPTVNSSAWDSCPSISADGLSLFFESNRPGGVGDQDIWVTSRPTPDSDWGPPVNLGPTVNSSAWDSCPYISADGLSLYFDSRRPGGSGTCDLWVTTRATVSDPWEQPVNLGPTVNSSASEYQPGISADGLILFFFSNRPGGSGDDDIWVTSRPTPDSDWDPPVNLGPTVNSSARDICPYISADGSTLYLTSERPGGQGGLDLWQASVDPIVDFNGDRIVDAEDMCIIVDHWGTDNSLCDIGPMPWGDGVVDVQDLIVLAEHLFEEVPPAE